MKRSTKKGLGLFGKKSRTKRHDERIDFDEQYDQYDEDYEDYDPEYDDEYDREYVDDDYDRDDDREYDDDYDRDDDREYDDDYDRDDRYDDEEDDYARDDDRDYEDDDYDRDEERYEDEPEDDDRYEDDVDDREYNGIPDDEYDREYEDEYYEDEEDYDREDDHYDEDDYDRDDRGYEDDDRYDDEYDRDYRDDRYDDEYDRDYDDRYEDDYDRYDDDYAPVRGRRDRGGRRDRSRKSGVEIFFAGAFEKIKNTSAVERIAAAVFLLLIAGAVATGIFYKTASTKNEQISSFADVGTTLSEVEVVGESGLLAMADAEKAKAMTAQMVEEEEEEEEIADDAKGVTVQMTLTSIKSDIKIKFINSETKKLVGNVHFEVSVKCPDGSTVTYDDHDKDGIIYKKDIKAGKYTVTPMTLSDEYSTYTLDTSSKTITVKDTVEMKAVDVSNEVKKESQVNAAKEDTQVKTEVESQLKDTVEWVESTKTAIGDNVDGEHTYVKVDKSNITDPTSGSALKVGRYMLAFITEDTKKIEVSKSSINIDEGSSDSFEVSGVDEFSVSCESDKVSVTKDGNTVKVEGKNTGEATITVSSGEETKTVSVTVKAKEIEKKDILVSKSSTTVDEGGTDTFEVSGVSEYEVISSDSSKVSVSKNGKTVTVKGEKAGESATITISSSEPNNGSKTVVVTVNAKALGTIGVSKENISVKEGGNENFNVSGPSNVDIQIDTKIATATYSNGTVTVHGVKASDQPISLKLSASGYEDKTVSVTVGKPELMDITVDSSSVPLKKGAETSVKVTGPSNFKIKDDYKKDIVEVTVSGNSIRLKGKAVGKTDIVIEADGFNPKTISIDVTDVTALEMSYNKLTILEGQKTKIKAKNESLEVKLRSENTGIATVSGNEVTGVKEGTTKIYVSANGYSETPIELTVKKKGANLKTKDNKDVYVKRDGKYVIATSEDYFKDETFYIIDDTAGNYRYTGWQTIDGKTYFYDKNGDRVKGEQVIQGAKYTFDGDGALVKSPGAMGIDVSKWNGNIDWNAVKNSGVNFVIIRCGYRGSSEGTLIEDPKFRANIKGAQAAGLRVGVYFFTQAVNEVEAVEEASMVISLCKGYSLSFPVYLDVEGSNGRGDRISADQRTANIKAFCGTIKNAGYQVGVYANKTWFTSKINTSQITGYKIWLAQYASQVTYTGSRYDMWQYTSKGKVTGISGNVDMNICY